MRLATQRQIVDFLRQKGAPKAMRAALGDYSEDDPNVFNRGVYSEAEVFNGGAGGTNAGYTVMPPQAIPAFVQRNITTFATYPFNFATGSTTILPANQQRTLLLVQNQNAAGGADLYVNFGTGAGIGNGVLIPATVGLIFDTVCPNNGINLFSVGPMIGCAVEGVSSL